VHSGLQLAAEEESLKRAESCNGLAERLAAEIRRSVQNGEPERVVELADHLHSVLAGGVAANLAVARRQIAPDSTGEKDLQQVRDRAADLVKPLEEELRRVLNPEDSEQTLQALNEGRREVELAVQTPSPASPGT
jgi:hypothetical protein